MLISFLAFKKPLLKYYKFYKIGGGLMFIFWSGRLAKKRVRANFRNFHTMVSTPKCGKLPKKGWERIVAISTLWPSTWQLEKFSVMQILREINLYNYISTHLIQVESTATNRFHGNQSAYLHEFRIDIFVFVSSKNYFHVKFQTVALQFYTHFEILPRRFSFSIPINRRF